MGFYERKVYPFLLDRATRNYARDRAALVGRASGRVLEVGIGDGANLPFYPGTVEQVVGLDASRPLLDLCRQRAQALHAAPEPTPSLTLQQGSVEALSFREETFDSAVTFLVFCSVRDPQRAARELFRVLKPGGRLLFFEHVRAPSPRLSRWQRRLNPIWRMLAGGCNLDRDTRRVFQSAGFVYEDLQEFYHPGAVKLISPKMMGVARRPA